MYKCLECGHIFEDGEQNIIKEDHGLSGGFYEEFACCPVCNGDFVEVFNCDKCNKVMEKDNLYDGLCLDCLEASATFSNLYQFLKENELLHVFMCEKFFEMPCPSSVSDKFLACLDELFLRQKANDLLCDKTYFLDMLKKYVLEGDGEIGLQVYAEWLNNKEERE